MQNGSNLIDSVTGISGIIEYVEGCEVINYNDIMETDYRAYMIDISVQEYFKKEFSI